MAGRVSGGAGLPEDRGAETFALDDTPEEQGEPHLTLSPVRRKVRRELETLSTREMAETPSTSGSDGTRVLQAVGHELPRLCGASGTAEVVILEPIARGGMGVVELAEQRALRREVAVKRVRPDRMTPSAVRALLDEARLTGSLEHPNIIPVHTLGLDERGEPMLVMKRVEGHSWKDLIRDPQHVGWGKYSQDRLGRHLEILIQVCNAVSYAHSRGVVHCDLKTENVMLGAYGEIYVLDWGIALRLGSPRQRAVAGTPAFMAPEMVAEDGQINERTDVFLLGGMLHEALTGTHRHAGSRSREVLQAALRCDPPVYGAEVPAELAQLCRRATARDPADRPESAQAFQAALFEFQRHRGSLRLSDAAEAVLAQMIAVLEGAPARPTGTVEAEARRSTVRRLAAEAAFGFRQALGQWPENPGAREGLRRCLLRTAEFELAERKAVAVGQILDELGEAPDELRARLQALLGELEAEGRASAELSQLRHESSAEVAIGTRSVLMFAVHTLIGAFWVGMAHIDLTLSHLGIIGFGLSLLFGLVLGFYLLRHSLLATQFNRRILYSLIGFCVFTVVHASLGIVRDVPVDHLAWGGFLGISLMFAVLAFTLTPTVGLLVPPTLLAAVFCAFYPERLNESLALFNFGCAVAWLVPLALRLRARGRSAGV